MGSFDLGFQKRLRVILLDRAQVLSQHCSYSQKLFPFLSTVFCRIVYGFGSGSLGLIWIAQCLISSRVFSFHLHVLVDAR